uniref:Uncharacterized protein n=1 Tax=Eutreptiella gymnastica TaxID=73025 RepID=A0A7S1I558_9EUGL
MATNEWVRPIVFLIISIRTSSFVLRRLLHKHIQVTDLTVNTVGLAMAIGVGLSGLSPEEHGTWVRRTIRVISLACIWWTLDGSLQYSADYADLVTPPSLHTLLVAGCLVAIVWWLQLWPLEAPDTHAGCVERMTPAEWVQYQGFLRQHTRSQLEGLAQHLRQDKEWRHRLSAGAVREVERFLESGTHMPAPAPR